MRRGHPGASGWRGENKRPYRPRGGGPQSFRPSRPFGHLEAPRFTQPGPRQYRGPRPFSQHPGRQDNVLQPEYHDRNNFRINKLPRPHDRGYHNREPYHQARQNEDHEDAYNESNYYQDKNSSHINKIGDVDNHRQHQISPWANPPQFFQNSRQYYDDHKSPYKTPKHGRLDAEEDLPDYSGHRPPASDHYSTTTGPNNNNSQYSHSVDDTVDIIRKRLQNRDKQQNFDTSTPHQSNTEEENLTKNTNDIYQNIPPVTPTRKRIQRQKQNIKSNCHKMKSNIVNQLFKMDKTKINKLMDDPSSSTKFEYAISSLITEGQNSLNRHLRSAAEKSLCSSSSDFIQSDTNTIYEDTFMKQMQGVLDPQDSILLEDIKPLVMAELSRVLQLDNFQLELMQDQTYQNQELQNDMYEQGMHNYDQEYHMEHPKAKFHYDDVQNIDHYSQDSFYDQSNVSSRENDTETMLEDVDNRYDYQREENFDTKPLFERRQTNRFEEKRISSERRKSTSSVDRTFGHMQSTNESSKEQHQSTLPLFNPNTDQLSDEDDPFAELDQQYHVAVDHNFIGNEYASQTASPISSTSQNKSPSEISAYNSSFEVENATTSYKTKQNLENQHQNVSTTNNTEPEMKFEVEIKQECSNLEKENFSAIPHNNVEPNKNHKSHEDSNKKKEIKNEQEKLESSAKSVLQSNIRKRSSDQKPSHRKEKRKRSSQSESHEPDKSILNMFYSNDSGKEATNTNKKSDSTIKSYSDKYVKRKEPQKKTKDKDSNSSKITENKKHDIIPSHSSVSPKENSVHESPHKSDPKTKLKHINMFEAPPPKKGSLHQAHRNTAPTPHVDKSLEDKPKLIVPTASSFARKLIKKHVGTQVILKSRSKECQTDKPKRFIIGTQTEPVTISKVGNISTNPLERMKEIDIEIQVLLEEKFKLYHSLETKSAAVSMDTMPNLSMRVFKLNTEETDNSADAIVEDFTSIPTEELEQIAMETIADEKAQSLINKQKSRRQKTMERVKNSPTPSTKKYNKRVNSPNISLIEQIITDNRPIEDIISLDALETAPLKIKKKQQKKKPSKKTKQSKTNYLSKYNIKECYVLLERIDIKKHKRVLKNTPKLNVETTLKEEPEPQENIETIEQHANEPEEIQPAMPSMVEVIEEVVNDLQFDMLDVSEDIVIGDNCEVKCMDTTPVKESITEEIILDNSQSSMEDGALEEPLPDSDNECKMYDYSNENLCKDSITVTGNADAVLAIECIDNDFLAACLDGNVYHFSGTGQLLNTLRGTNQAVTCLTIVKEKDGVTVYTGSLDSRMRYYDLETGMEKGPECIVLSPIQTMDRAWDTIYVGTRTGFVMQFVCKNNMVIPVSTIKFSEQSILALRAMKEGPRKVLLVAARSENVVTVRDAQTGLLLRSLQGPKMTVYTLLYEDGKVYCGTSSHNVHVFDYTSGGHVGSHEGGKGAVCLRASGGLVFAGCYDGCVYVYREGERRPRAQLRGPGLMLLSLAIHGTKIIAGYKDRGLYIWKMPLAIVQEMIL